MTKTKRLLFAFWLALIPACGLLLEKGNEIVAEIGKDVVRVRDLQSRIRDISFERRAEANDTIPARRIEVRRGILEEMVAERIMVLEAQDRGYVVSEEEIDAYLEAKEQQEKAAVGDGEYIDAGTPSRGHEHEEHAKWEVDKARSDLLIKKVKEQDLSRSALRAYYNEHIEEYRLDSPWISYEIIAVVPGPSSALVDDVYKFATEKNTTLLEAYRAVNRSREIVMGGIMPTTSVDALSDPMRKAIEPLEQGDVSRPLMFDQDGKEYYAVVRVARLKKNQPLPTIRDEIEQKVYAELIQSLEKKFGVVYHEDKLDYRLE